MKPKQMLMLAGIVVVAAFVLLLAFRNPQPPMMPRDAAHATFDGPKPCLECHAPGRSVPQSPKHPFGLDCTRCHGSR